MLFMSAHAQEPGFARLHRDGSKKLAANPH
jgi:hypothetical protein